MLTHHYSSFKIMFLSLARGARRKPWAWIVATLCFLVIFWAYHSNYKNRGPIIDLSQNYFQTTTRLSKGQLLVNNDKCQIPKINEWNTDVVSVINKVSQSNCSHHQLNLTYVAGQNVIINEQVLESLGYQINDLSCCYRVVKRIQQTKYNYDKDADSNFKYSETCYPMNTVTQPRSSFIVVTCTAGYSFKSFVNYKNFHVVARLPVDEEDDEATTQKISFWKECRSGKREGEYCNKGLQTRPPNVLLIGIDSTSQLNFHRFMKQSINVLENELGAVEMNGYTKVGENTFPNFVPLMTNFSEDELRTVCYPSRWKPQDNCPYLWKDFSKLNYLTGHFEDSPKMAIFNYQKTGFIESPVDIYLRPWMRAAYGNSWTVDCIGNLRPEKHILDYIQGLAKLSENAGLPYFFTTWLTDLTHESPNKLQLMDALIANSLQSLKNKGLLNNTILFLISDHGYRFGEIRITPSGWYEDKLPAMYIRLPDWISKKYPRWLAALKHNSKQLSTPFDVHATLRDILSLASTGHLGNARIHQKSSNTRGLSLFQKLPERSCDEAGVPKEFCACNPPIAYTSNLTVIRQGADKVIRHINHALPSVCEPLKIETITAVATLSNLVSRKHNTLHYKHHNELDETVNFIVSFTTCPAGFRFEASIIFNSTVHRFTRISHILRTNKMNRGTSCLDGLMGEAVGMEQFCYCKGFEYTW